MELIPAIDLKDGRCVRLLRGDFDAETVYSHEPGEVLAVALGVARGEQSAHRVSDHDHRQLTAGVLHDRPFLSAA